MTPELHSCERRQGWKRDCAYVVIGRGWVRVPLAVYAARRRIGSYRAGFRQRWVFCARNIRVYPGDGRLRLHDVGTVTSTGRAWCAVRLRAVREAPGFG